MLHEIMGHCEVPETCKQTLNIYLFLYTPFPLPLLSTILHILLCSHTHLIRPAEKKLQNQLERRKTILLVLTGLRRLSSAPELLSALQLFGAFLQDCTLLTAYAQHSSQGSASMGSTNHGSKIFGKIIPESSKKQNFNLPSTGHQLHCTHTCLHSIYIVFGIISNLEMI